MTKTNQITIEKVANLIKSANYLKPDEKKKWATLIQSINQDQLTEVYKYFRKNLSNQNKFKLFLIGKHRMLTKFANTVKQITNKFIQKAIKNRNNAI